MWIYGYMYILNKSNDECKMNFGFFLFHQKQYLTLWFNKTNGNDRDNAIKHVLFSLNFVQLRIFMSFLHDFSWIRKLPDWLKVFWQPSHANGFSPETRKLITLQLRFDDNIDDGDGKLVVFCYLYVCEGGVWVHLFGENFAYNIRRSMVFVWHERFECVSV